MRIAFYAPMKPPDDPVPSGDREVARQLWACLQRADFQPALASRFVSFDGTGDADRQRQLAETGAVIAADLLVRYRETPANARPRLWFTYHLYHKAPDWLGPRIAAGLGIPYVVAEASHAGKQAQGPWSLGYTAAAQAIATADLVFSPNPDDDEGVLSLLNARERLVPLPPCIDVQPFAQAAARRNAHRQRLAERYHLEPDQPWLLTVAMMRRGAKLASYGVLAAALARLAEQRDDLPWRLLVAGSGEASEAVCAAFRPLAARTRWLGEVDRELLTALFAAADLYLWPAIDEAYGVALIEAQAAGLPVIAGARPGVAAIVRADETGILTPPGDAGAFCAATARLLDNPVRRRHMGASAAVHARQRHHLDVAARAFRRYLTPLVIPIDRNEGDCPRCPAA